MVPVPTFSQVTVPVTVPVPLVKSYGSGSGSTTLLSDNLLGKKFSNSLKIGLNFFLYRFKDKIIFNFVK
jgi:hypothetical protein